MKSKNNEANTTTPQAPAAFTAEQIHMLQEYFEGPELNTTIRNLTHLLIHCLADEEQVPAIYPEIYSLTGLLSTAMHFADLQGRAPRASA